MESRSGLNGNSRRFTVKYVLFSDNSEEKNLESGRVRTVCKPETDSDSPPLEKVPAPSSPLTLDP